MNIVRKTVSVFGLSALVLGALASIPASAADRYVRHHQVRHAARLDRHAMHAAATGHYRAAARMRRHATHLRVAAHHGH